MRALYIRCTAKISLLASPGTWFKVVGPFIISVKSDYSRPCLSIVVSGLVLYGLFFLKSFRFVLILVIVGFFSLFASSQPTMNDLK